MLFSGIPHLTMFYPYGHMAILSYLAIFCHIWLKSDFLVFRPTLLEHCKGVRWVLEMLWNLHLWFFINVALMQKKVYYSFFKSCFLAVGIFSRKYSTRCTKACRCSSSWRVLIYSVAMWQPLSAISLTTTRLLANCSSLLKLAERCHDEHGARSQSCGPTMSNKSNISQDWDPMKSSMLDRAPGAMFGKTGFPLAIGIRSVWWSLLAIASLLVASNCESNSASTTICSVRYQRWL